MSRSLFRAAIEAVPEGQAIIAQAGNKERRVQRGARRFGPGTERRSMMPRLTLKHLSIRVAALALPIGLAGPAAAQSLDACWLEVRTGHAQGQLQAFAAPRIAGAYELTVRQDGGNGELLVDQTGSFLPYNAWPTSLSRVYVGAAPLRANQRVPLQSIHAAQPGTKIISSSPGRANGPGALPAAAFGFRADLRVYDTSGGLICRDTQQWR
jgi:hypothetical protein